MRATLAKTVIASISGGLWLVSAATATDQATRAKVTAGYLQSPMIFEMNEGQSDPPVKALARGSRYGLFLTSDESVFVLSPGAKDEAVVRVRTMAANPAPQVTGLERLDSTSNYYIGNDQSKWRKSVANYARVKYSSIYPGIDLIYYGNQRQLEYDYVVAPGGDPNSIHLAVEGASKLRIDRHGDLVLETQHGAIYQHKPVMYQQIDGARREVAGSFLLQGNRVSFKLGDYDRTKDLVIDPSLIFLTYLGGSGTDEGKALAITTASGVTLVAGSTSSASFPIVNVAGVTSNSYTSETDGFLAVLNPAGTKLFNSTYVGGAGGVNVINGIAIDNFEVPAMLYVAGYTTSRNFDVVNAAQPKYAGATDAWVAQILLTLNVINFVPPEYTLTTSIGFATYLGGTGNDEITGVAIDQNTKDVFVTGHTTSINFPVTAGALQSKNAGGEDAFVARYASGTGAQAAGTLEFSTYLGGKGTDYASGIAVYTDTTTGVLTAYVSGTTTSTTLGAALAGSAEPSGASAAASRGFLVAVSSNGATTQFTDFIGSSTRTTRANAVTTDANGAIYVTGNTNDSTLPVVNPVQEHYAAGGNDAFVGAYNSSGTATFLSYWGGSGYDVANGIAVFLTANSDNTTSIDLFIAGYTTGKTFPLLNAVQPTYGGGATDGFVAMFSSSHGSAFTEGYSTFLGGPGTDLIYGLAVGTSGNARVTGLTNSTNGIATPGAFQTTNGGGYDAFLGEIQTTP